MKYIIHSPRHALNSFKFLSTPTNCCKSRRQVEHFNLIMSKHRWTEEWHSARERERERHRHGTTSSRSGVTCVTCHAHSASCLVLKYQISCDTHAHTHTDRNLHAEPLWTDQAQNQPVVVILSVYLGYTHKYIHICTYIPSHIARYIYVHIFPERIANDNWRTLA